MVAKSKKIKKKAYTPRQKAKKFRQPSEHEFLYLRGLLSGMAAHSPEEVCKDEFAYDRLLAQYKRLCAHALKVLTDGLPVPR